MDEKKYIYSNCCHLCSKMAYSPIPGEGENWRTNQSSVVNYWCLRTMIPMGPDDYLVAPEVCQGNRDCYQDKDADLINQDADLT